MSKPIKPDLYPYDGANRLWQHACDLNAIRRQDAVRSVNRDQTTRVYRRQTITK